MFHSAGGVAGDELEYWFAKVVEFMQVAFACRTCRTDCDACQSNRVVVFCGIETYGKVVKEC